MRSADSLSPMAPKLVMIRELAEAQRTVALDVLAKMIDPSAVAR